MRKESSNQFTEGLVCDLNPINTPNTVLTDSLNATIITYDGNEYSLQNDRGNYPLENCRLKPNYIPVGLKEYGDILYIVSYNPLTNDVEIGTYPSPVDIKSSIGESVNLELQSVIEQVDGFAKYSELIEKSNIKVWTANSEEDSKLYPGDEYKLSIQEPSPYKYESLEYFIIDENREKYNISDLVEIDNQWHPVSWQIPGWIASQYRLGTFDDFTMSMRSVEVPTLGDGRPIDGLLNLNFQFRLSDYLFLPSEINSEENIKADLGIELTFKSRKTITDTISLSDGKFIEWYSNSKILWIDYSKKLTDLQFGDTIVITAVPFVKITTGETTRRIDYDSFTETHSIYLNSVGSYSDFMIGDQIWKFYIDEDDENRLYLEYNITGPNVTKTAVQLYYRALDIDGKSQIRPWSTVENYSGITNQGIGILSFDKQFQKEAIYVIEFAFYEPNKDLSKISNLTTIKRLVIASRIFSDFVGEYLNFNEIDFDTWISKYKDSVISTNWNSNYSSGNNTRIYKNFDWNDELYIDGKSFAIDSLKKLWNKKYLENDKGIVNESELGSIEKRKEKLVIGSTYKSKITLNHNTQALDGKLWNGTPNIILNLNSEIDSVTKAWNRKSVSNSKTLEEDINIVLGEARTYGYSKEIDFDHIDGIEQINNVPIMHLHVTSTNKNANEGLKLRLEDFGEWEDGFYKKEKYFTYKEESVSSSYTSIGNTISQMILSNLGSANCALLCVTIYNTKLGNSAGWLQLRHGDNYIRRWNQESNTWLYTYLVFRRSARFKNAAVLIPIKDTNYLWDVTLGSGNISTMENAVTDFDLIPKISDYLKKFSNGIRICTTNNAIKKSSIVSIQEELVQELPICTAEVSTPSFDVWMYGNKNLLNYNSRNSIIQTLGKDICGKLLTGSVSKIPAITFYFSNFENKNPENNSSLFTDVTSQISLINQQIHIPTQDTELLNLIPKSSQTKGVYWLGAKEPSKLINLLNSSYANTENTQLVADSANISDANMYLTNDKDGLAFAYVDTVVTATIDD